MALSDEINAAVGAHGLWKSRLKQAIETGQSEFTVNEVCRDDRCAFGKWLYSPDLAAEVKHSGHYGRCLGLHADFHREAAKVLSMALAGNKAGALQSMGLTGEFAGISMQLTKAMREWLNAA